MRGLNSSYYGFIERQVLFSKTLEIKLWRLTPAAEISFSVVPCYTSYVSSFEIVLRLRNC